MIARDELPIFDAPLAPAHRSDFGSSAKGPPQFVAPIFRVGCGMALDCVSLALVTLRHTLLLSMSRQSAAQNAKTSMSAVDPTETFAEAHSERAGSSRQYWQNIGAESR
jgi:hypothetical protein